MQSTYVCLGNCKQVYIQFKKSLDLLFWCTCDMTTCGVLCVCVCGGGGGGVGGGWVGGSREGGSETRILEG